MSLKYGQISTLKGASCLDSFSSHDVKSPRVREPLNPVGAKALIRRIRESGSIVLSGEARRRMREREVSAVEIDHALRAGVVDPGEYANGSWRYRVRSHQICVVVAFDSAAELVVVTTWRW